MSTTNKTENNFTSEASTKVVSPKCQICGVSAQHAFFGVICCRACKMFLKRNTNSKKETLACRYDGHCEININTRHICTFCRLAKCFQCEMTSNKFRPSRQTQSIINTVTDEQKSEQLERS